MAIKYGVENECRHCGRRYSNNWDTLDQVAALNETGWECPHCGHRQVDKKEVA